MVLLERNLHKKFEYCKRKGLVPIGVQISQWELLYKIERLPYSYDFRNQTDQLDNAIKALADWIAKETRNSRANIFYLELVNFSPFFFNNTEWEKLHEQLVNRIPDKTILLGYK